MPWEKPYYGIVVFDDDQIGVWKTTADDKIIINLPAHELKKVVDLSRDNGAVLSFLIDPETGSS